MALLYAASIFLASSFSNACNRLMASRISPRALSASSRERALMPPELTLSSCAFVLACVAHFKRLLAIWFSSVSERKRLAARGGSRLCLTHGEETYDTIVSRRAFEELSMQGGRIQIDNFELAFTVQLENEDCGSREAVSRPPFPQNVACEFLIPRSSVVGSKRCRCLRLPVWETQVGSQQQRYPPLDRPPSLHHRCYSACVHTRREAPQQPQSA